LRAVSLLLNARTVWGKGYGDFLTHLRSSGVLAVASVLASAATSAVAQITIYDAAAPVQSAKRGVSAGTLDASDFTALSPGVSWWYNYGATPNQTVPANSGMTFIPMAWDGDSGELSSLSSYLAGLPAGNRPPVILAINEPNITGQAVMTPSQAATVYANVVAIAKPYGIPVSGPQMPTGGDTGITSTSQYLSDFYSASSTPVAGIGIHPYDNFGAFTSEVGQGVSDAGGRTLTVSEFDYYDATSTSAQLNYMVQAVDYLENDPSVTSYAWFYARTSNPSSSPYISLLTASPGVLSTLGQLYVNMPVHSPNVYYRPNGQLQADRYTTATSESISLTSDPTPGIYADMTSTAANALLNYDIYVAQAGTFLVGLRNGGASGDIKLFDGATLLSTVIAPGGAYITLSTDINLPAGYDSLTVELQNSGQVIDSLNFTAVPEPACLSMIAGGLFVLQLRRGRRRQVDRIPSLS